MQKTFLFKQNPLIFATPKGNYTEMYVGAVAQLVEQWTENPCVAGSIPAHTTALKMPWQRCRGFLFSKCHDQALIIKGYITLQKFGNLPGC